MKKLLVIGLIVLAGLWVVRKTHICSYAGTLWSTVRQEAKAQVPTKFELDRIRHEIARMDGDIRGMVSPIAEHMATISRLRKDIQRSETTLADQKASMLDMTAALDKGEELVSYKGRHVPAERIRKQVQREFNSFKLLETQLETQKKLLAAKEKTLEGTREQLNKLIAKKRDFEVRVAQLEAEEQLLTVARTATNIQVDDSRATDIQEALNGVEHRQEVERNKLILTTGDPVTDGLPTQDQPTASVDEIRNYLQGNNSGSTRTVSQK
jgi:chromosome segregation ATPase